MQQRKTRSLMMAGAILLVGVVAGAATGVPGGVSPGDADRFTGVEATCPTFSWQHVPGGDVYEIQVFALPEDLDLASGVGTDLSTAELVIQTWLPEGVTSWTPSMEHALERGVRYAWFVRALSLDSSGEIDVVGEWSDERLFAVSQAPTLQELELALEVLRSQGRDSDSRSLEVATGGRTQAEERSDGRRNVQPGVHVQSRSVISGPTAVTGEMPDPAGETYGVVGISSSAEGSGIGAANTAGGADLVLDGSAGGVADTELRESGIDRPAPTTQTFDITNSGAGSMTPRVDGVDVVTTLTDRDTLAGLGCGSGQLARWSGASWVCSDDEDTLAELACASNQVANWTGSAWACAEDEDTILEVGPGLVLAGNQVGIDPTMFYTSTSIVDGPDMVGRYPSVALGSDGLALVSYWDETNDDLKVAHCDDVECTSATVTTVDGVDNVGKYSSFAVGVDGLPLISYYDETNQDLKVAHCDDLFCGSETITTLDSAGAAGLDTAITIGADGLALIVYRVSGTLKVAHCNDLACTGANLSSLESGRAPSLAIGTDGFALIAYRGGSADLKVAHCINLVCSSFTMATLDADGDVGGQSSIVIGTDGLGIVTYNDATNHVLKTAHCSNVDCSSAYVKLHDAEPGLWEGIGPSVGIGPDGMPRIAHCDSPAYLIKVTRCSHPWCGGAVTTTVFGTDPYVFTGTAMAIGADGLPLIVATESNNDDLWAVHLPYGN